MTAGRIFLNSDWKSSLLNPLQGSEVWYHHRSDDRKYVCASQATFATAIVTKIVLQRWTRLAFATALIFNVVYTLDRGLSLSGWTPRKIHSIKTEIRWFIFYLHFTLVASRIQLWSTRIIHQRAPRSLKLDRSGSLTTMTLFIFTASCWLVTKVVLIPGKCILNPPCYTEEEAVLKALKTE